MGAAHLTLHGPFLDLNPAAYDSQIRQVTRLRFDQSYEAARELGVEKIIYHSCYYPQVYFLEGWAERVAEFMNQFLEGRSDHRSCIGKCIRSKMGVVKSGCRSGRGR